MAEQVSAQISGWLQSAFEHFLDSESPSLMQATDLGAFKYAAEEKRGTGQTSRIMPRIAAEPCIDI